MKYVLMFVDTEEFHQEFQALSPPEREQAYERVNQWFVDHAAKIVDRGAKLQGAESATTVRLGAGGPVITDGPFIEGKEVISGYVVIEVADLDEALEIVKTWPGCPVVEIRPVES